MGSQVPVSSGAASAKENEQSDGSVIGSLVNKAIDSLSIELHIPGYRYCGPGTSLEDRLNRDEPGVNRLDCACREHDIAYQTHADTANRTIADEKLRQEAKNIFKSSDVSLKERLTAWLVAKTMKVKVRLAKKSENSNNQAESQSDGEERTTKTARSQLFQCC